MAAELVRTLVAEVLAENQDNTGAVGEVLARIYRDHPFEVYQAVVEVLERAVIASVGNGSAEQPA